jgi:hypothetical protein
MRFRLRRNSTVAPLPNVPACRASDDDGPTVRGDGTGWVSVHASPSWWRGLPTIPDLDTLTEKWAQIGEVYLDPALCRVVGSSSSGHPCPIDITNGPCPLHGELPDSEQPDGERLDTDRCGQLTKAGTPCRWDTSAHGPCLSHRVVQVQR